MPTLSAEPPSLPSSLSLASVASSDGMLACGLFPDELEELMQEVAVGQTSMHMGGTTPAPPSSPAPSC